MKSGKYLAGGLIRGLAGKGIKSFMKSDIYKQNVNNLKKQMDKLYAKSTAPDKKFKAGLKKLDIKMNKADIIQDALKFTAKNYKSRLSRTMQASMLVGARNLDKYKKKLGTIGKEYLKKRFSKQKVN